MTCKDCKYCKRCDESDRNYICTSFCKTKLTGKMLTVSKIRTKMYAEEMWGNFAVPTISKHYRILWQANKR